MKRRSFLKVAASAIAVTLASAYAPLLARNKKKALPWITTSNTFFVDGPMESIAPARKKAMEDLADNLERGMWHEDEKHAMPLWFWTQG